MNETDYRLLRRCVEIAHESMEKGNHPFGALLADKDGNILLEQGNEFQEGGSAYHAETLLLLKAAKLYAPEKLKECTKYTFDAPLCFIVCCDSSKAYTRGYDGKNSAEIDASIVTTHMMLQAQDIGLGTTWVMAFNPTKVRECFSIADNLDIIALLPTGYPAEDVTVSPLHEKSIDITEMASYNEF